MLLDAPQKAVARTVTREVNALLEKALEKSRVSLSEDLLKTMDRMMGDHNTRLQEQLDRQRDQDQEFWKLLQADTLQQAADTSHQQAEQVARHLHDLTASRRRKSSRYAYLGVLAISLIVAGASVAWVQGLLPI